MIRIAAVGFVLVALFAPSGFALESPELVRDSLFEAANQALGEANLARASLLAPDTYQAGAQRYRRAESRFEKRGSIDRMERDLDAAGDLFNQATTRARMAEQVLANALAARADALSAGAQNLSTERWESAEQLFARAARKLESESIKSGQRLGAEATGAYRSAELDAIKTNHLAQARKLIEEAEEHDAQRYAPETFEAAGRMLAEAESLLQNHRYDTDRPRALAKNARQAAELAIHIAGVAAAIDKKDLTVEELLLDWQSSLEAVGTALHLSLDFGAGHERPASTIVAAIGDLHQRLSHQADLEVQVAALREALGTESQALARHADVSARYREIESMFSPQEAEVSRKGNQIYVRMVGLTFDSGKAALKPEHDALLAKLQLALALFPDSSVVVEGHTDSFGGDTENLALSDARADAVYAYLLANSLLGLNRITYTGYGESRPIANNETAAGRARNRRIDVVVTTDI